MLHVVQIPSGTYDWTKVSLTFTIGPNVGDGYVGAVAGTGDILPYAQGTYYIDDIQFYYSMKLPRAPRPNICKLVKIN